MKNLTDNTPTQDATILRIKRYLTEKGYDVAPTSGHLHKSFNCSFFCINVEKKDKAYSFIFCVSNDPKKTHFSIYKEMKSNA